MKFLRDLVKQENLLLTVALRTSKKKPFSGIGVFLFL